MSGAADASAPRAQATRRLADAFLVRHANQLLGIDLLQEEPGATPRPRVRGVPELDMTDRFAVTVSAIKNKFTELRDAGKFQEARCVMKTAEEMVGREPQDPNTFLGFQQPMILFNASAAAELQMRCFGLLLCGLNRHLQRQQWGHTPGKDNSSPPLDRGDALTATELGSAIETMRLAANGYMRYFKDVTHPYVRDAKEGFTEIVCGAAAELSGPSRAHAADAKGDFSTREVYVTPMELQSLPGERRRGEPPQELLLKLSCEADAGLGGPRAHFTTGQRPFMHSGRCWKAQSPYVVFLTGPYVILPPGEKARVMDWLRDDIDLQYDYPPPEYIVRCPGCGVSPFELSVCSGENAGCAIGFFSQQYVSCVRKNGLPMMSNKVFPRVWCLRCVRDVICPAVEHGGLSKSGWGDGPGSGAEEGVGDATALWPHLHGSRLSSLPTLMCAIDHWSFPDTWEGSGKLLPVVQRGRTHHQDHLYLYMREHKRLTAVIDRLPTRAADSEDESDDDFDESLLPGGLSQLMALFEEGLRGELSGAIDEVARVDELSSARRDAGSSSSARMPPADRTTPPDPPEAEPALVQPATPPIERREAPRTTRRVSGAPGGVVDGYQLGPDGCPIMRSDGSFVRASAAAATPASTTPGSAVPTSATPASPTTADATAVRTTAVRTTAAAAPTTIYEGKFKAAKAAFKAYVVYFNAHADARERVGVRPHEDYEDEADVVAAVRATRAEARAALSTLTRMWKALEASAPPAQLLETLHAMKELHQNGHLNCQDPGMGGEDTTEGRLWGVYRKAAQDLRMSVQLAAPEASAAQANSSSAYGRSMVDLAEFLATQGISPSASRSTPDAPGAAQGNAADDAAEQIGDVAADEAADVTDAVRERNVRSSKKKKRAKAKVKVRASAAAAATGDDEMPHGNVTPDPPEADPARVQPATPPAPAEEAMEVEAAISSLLVACNEAEIRAALLAAVPLRHVPAIASEIAEARLRLRNFKGERQAAQAAQARDAEQQLCVICQDGERRFAFVPCGHRVLCEECVRRKGEAGGATSLVIQAMPACPICRQPYTTVMRVYD